MTNPDYICERCGDLAIKGNPHPSWCISEAGPFSLVLGYHEEGNNKSFGEWVLCKKCRVMAVDVITDFVLKWMS